MRSDAKADETGIIIKWNAAFAKFDNGCEIINIEMQAYLHYNNIKYTGCFETRNNTLVKWDKVVKHGYVLSLDMGKNMVKLNLKIILNKSPLYKTI